MKLPASHFLMGTLLLAGLPALAQTNTTPRPLPRKTTPAPPARPSRATETAPARKPAAPPARAPEPLPAPTSTGLGAGTEGLFRKGTILVNAGLGLGTGYGFGSNLESRPALSISAEKGVLEGIGPGTVGVGGLIGYKGYSYQYPNTDSKATWNTFMLMARGTYHYDLLQIPQLDTYAGVSLGLRLESHRDKYSGTQLHTPDESYGGAHFDTGIFLGGRYFLTKNFGAFAEAGYDMTYLKLGLTGRF